MLVEVWSDVVCPWCYIGKRRLEAALERFAHRDDVEVVWRSFELDPTLPEGRTQPTLPMLAAKYGSTVEQMRARMAQVEQIAAAEGLEYHLADGNSGNTTLAHELLHLAAEVGLDEAEVRAALTARRYRDAVREAAATAHVLAATGVPYFVVDRRYGAAGAQSVELLLRLLERY